MKDDYVKYFVKNPVRRPPIINRGYFARALAIDILLHKFLSSPLGPLKQIVSLGAGFDTRYFQSFVSLFIYYYFIIFYILKCLNYTYITV